MNKSVSIIIRITLYIFIAFQLETERLNLKAIQDLWGSSAAAAGNTNFPLHPSHESTINCEPEPTLQIGYTPLMHIYIYKIMFTESQQD